MNKHESARKKYLPKDLKILFVAEAPPEDITRFFYYEDVNDHDALFINLVRVLYPELRDENSVSIEQIRSNKAQILKRFREDGYYLVDALPKPISLKLSSSKRKRMIEARKHEIADEVVQLLANTDHDQAGIVLIKATVQDALETYLRAEGLPVRNQSRIPFPLMGHAAEFADGIHRALALFDRSYRIRTKFTSYDGDIEITKAR